MLMICALICIHLQNKGRLKILVDVSFFTEILLLKVILVNLFHISHFSALTETCLVAKARF